MSTDPETLQALVHEGLTIRQIAAQLGVSTRTAARRLQAAGLVTQHSRGGARKGAGRPPALSADETRAWVAQAEQEGWGQRRTAKEAGVSVNGFRSAMVRHDVDWWR